MLKVARIVATAKKFVQNLLKAVVVLGEVAKILMTV